MKAFHHWSATQVSTFRLCNRKWYLNKIVGMEGEETQALKDGKRYAVECETYMKTGSSAGMSAVTRPVAGLGDRFPKPGHRNTLVEYPIGEDTRPEGERTVGVHATILDVDGIPGVGFMDVCDIKEDRPIAWDFKSTKALKYVKTSEELTKDVQMAGVYAPAVYRIHQERYGKPPQLVGVAHVAMPKPPLSPDAIVVGPVWLTPEQVETQWQGVKESVRKMRSVALIESPIGVIPTWSACGAFGGCPYRETCQAIKTLKPGQSFVPPTQQSGSIMSLLSSLAAAKSATPAPIATAKVTTTPSPALGIAGRVAAALAAKTNGVNPSDAAKSAGSTAGIAAALKPAPVQAAPAPAAAAPAASGKRAPRNGDKRLAELGWDEYAISCMDIDRKHLVLDNKLQAPTNESDQDAPCKDWDLNSNEALERAIELGWSDSDCQLMSDEVLTEILTLDRSAVDYELEKDGSSLVERPKAAPPVVARRVRGPKVEETVAVVEETSAAVEETSAAVEAAVERAVKLSLDLDLLVVYVGCRPTKGVIVTELAEHLAPAMREIEALKGVSFYSLPSFNEGEKLLATSLLLNPIRGHVVVDQDASYAKYVLDVLIPQATIVVRA